MYLNRVFLNPRNKDARRDLASPYAMHQSLKRIFSLSDQECTAFLWRLETEQPNLLLVQSEMKPQWDKINQVDYFQHCDLPLPLNYFSHLAQGQLLRFRLKANPTVTRNQKRLGIFETESQIQWLSQRSAKHGFILNDVMVSVSQLERFYKKRGGHRIQIQTVVFDGVLKVQNLELLQRAVFQGIGSAKSFGCGLLSLARARD